MHSPHSLDLTLSRHATTLNALGFASSLYLIVDKGLKGGSAAWALAAAVIFGLGAILAVFGAIVAEGSKPWREDVSTSLGAAAFTFCLMAAIAAVIAIWPMAGITGADLVNPAVVVTAVVLCMAGMLRSVIRTINGAGPKLPAEPVEPKK